MRQSLRPHNLRRIVCLFALFLGPIRFAAVRAQAPPYTWAASVGTTTLGQVGTADRHDCDITTIAVTRAGQTYVTGSFKRSVEFGPTTLVSAGEQDVFLAKLDANGQAQWAVRAGDRSDDAGFSVAVDAADNAYVAGYFRYSATFGSFTLTSGGAFQGFLAKYDPQGVCQWAVAIPQAGGFGVPSATFGTLTIPNRGGGNFDAYVAKLDANGNFLWAEGMGGTDNDVASELVVDDDGSTYVTGEYQDYGIGATFGALLMPNLGRRFGQCFVAKLSAGGTFDWVATSSSGTYDEFGQSVALDHRGGVYAAGFYSGPSIGFGATTLVGNPGAHTGFLAKVGDSPLAKVVGLSPAQGAAGTPVTVRGARLAGTTAVYFNGVPAASFAVTSPTTVTAVAPAGVTTGPVSVQTSAGPSPAGLVFQVGTATSTAGIRTSGNGCWPNPVAAGGRVQVDYGIASPRRPAQATLYTLLGQPVVVRPVPPSGEVELGRSPVEITSWW